MLTYTGAPIQYFVDYHYFVLTQHDNIIAYFYSSEKNAEHVRTSFYRAADSTMEGHQKPYACLYSRSRNQFNIKIAGLLRATKNELGDSNKPFFY